MTNVTNYEPKSVRIYTVRGNLGRLDVTLQAHRLQDLMCTDDENRLIWYAGTGIRELEIILIKTKLDTPYQLLQDDESTAQQSSTTKPNQLIKPGTGFRVHPENNDHLFRVREAEEISPKEYLGAAKRVFRARERQHYLTEEFYARLDAIVNYTKSTPDQAIRKAAELGAFHEAQMQTLPDLNLANVLRSMLWGRNDPSN